MDGNSEQLQVINLKQLPIIEERLRDVKAKIEQRTSAVMALAVTEETRTDVKKIRTEVRKELEGYEAQRMAVKKAIMTPYEQFEAVYKECVSNPYKAADEALGKKIADVEVGIKQQKEDDVRAFFNELTSGFGLDWLKFEQMNLKVTLTCTPKAMKAAITQSVTKIVRDCAALEENPDRDEIMVEYRAQTNAVFQGVAAAMVKRCAAHEKTVPCCFVDKVIQSVKGNARIAVGAAHINPDIVVSHKVHCRFAFLCAAESITDIFSCS